MKSKRFVLFMIFSLLACAGVGIGSAYTPLGSPVAISGQGQIPFTGPAALLDDFSYGTPVNKWGAVTGAFGSKSPDPIGTCAASYEATTGTASNGNCLKLNYDVSVLNSYSGYSSNLGSASLASPVAYTAVSFWVKGAVGGELFKIQLSNNSATSYSDGSTTYKRNLASVYIPDYLDGGVTTTWKQVTIPFHNFANLDGFSSMKELSFVFENAQSTANGSVTQGAIYIDDIRFENIAIPAARIANFGEAVAVYQGLKKGICALGGNIGNGAAGGASGTLNKYSLSAVANEFALSAYGLKIEYDVNTGYSYTYLVFGGGNSATPATESGWVAIPHNFSAYNYLYVRVRGSTTGNPKTLKIEIADNGGTRAVAVTGITTAWQYWRIPLVGTDLAPGFISLDKTTIKKLTFTFEDWRIAGATGDKAGVVFIDDVQFEQ